MASKFVSMVYAQLKEWGVDTKGLSVQEAIELWNEKKGDNSSSVQKPTQESIDSNSKVRYNKSVESPYNPNEYINNVREEMKKVQDINVKKQMGKYVADLKKEPEITKDIEEIREKLGLDELIGKEYRIKSSKSFLRKLEKDGAKKSIKDNVRYTFNADEEDIVKAYVDTNTLLEEKGYERIISKNYWLDKTRAYKGINTNYISLSGVVFEIQYHSQESAKIKEINHKLYEEQRKISDETSKEYQDYEDKMWENSKKLKIPKNIGDVKTYGI